MRSLRACFGLVLALLALPRVSFAREPAPPSVAAPCSDGSGGTFVVWDEVRGGNLNLYAQHLDATGARLWGDDGIAVCEVAGEQTRPVLVTDGADGVIVVWQDPRSVTSALYAQRLDAAGQPRWPLGGIPVLASSQTVFSPLIAADGAGGAFVGCQGFASDADFLVQRLAPDGSLLWGSAGISLGIAGGNEYPAALQQDGTGVLALWTDTRHGGAVAYAQRLSSSGAPLWTAGGVRVASAGTDETPVDIAPDGASGAIVSLIEARSSSPQFRAQRLTAGGARAWGDPGVIVPTNAGWSFPAAIVALGDGGAIVAWRQYDVALSAQSLASQRLGPDGSRQWFPETTLRSAGTSVSELALVGDGAGGAIAAWVDFRSGFSDPGIRAQRVSGSGVPAWLADGVPACSAAGVQRELRLHATPDGGAIAEWKDFRFGTNSDSSYYAQRLSPLGVAQWAADGAEVIVPPGGMQFPIAASRTGGGAFVAWQEVRAGGSRVFARAYSALGAPEGPAIPVCDAPGRQSAARVVSDGVDGAVVVWTDARDEAAGDLYAQRVTPGGARLWGALAAPVCVAPGGQGQVSLAADGATGVLVAWEDQRVSSVHWNVYAQRLGADGVAAWTADGVPFLATTAWSAFRPAVVPDASGGAIVGLISNDALGYDHLYAWHVGATGAPDWTATLTSVTGLPSGPALAADGAGGAHAVWSTANGFFAGSDVVGQHVTALGLRTWGTDGTLLCAAAGDQLWPTLVREPGGDVVVAWIDARAGVQAAAPYAQRFSPAGGARWAADGVRLGATGWSQLGIRADGTGDETFVWLHPDPGANLQGQRLAPNGTPRWGPEGLALTTGLRSPATAFAGVAANGILLACQDQPETRHSRVLVSAVDSTGTATSGLPVTGAPGSADGLVLSVTGGTRAPVLAFAIPAGPPARIALCDVAGRRVGGRALVHGAAGVLPLSALGAARPGLYFARLSQGGATVTRRIVYTP